MKKVNDRYIYTVTDLKNFTINPIITWLDRFYIENPDKIQPDETGAIDTLLSEQGKKFEEKVLEKYKDQGRNIYELSKDVPNPLEKTIAAMKQGHEIIYQAYLENASFYGYCDFLFKKNDPSNLGNYHYEAFDVKLSGTIKNEYITQVCAYTDILQEIQGLLPENIGIILWYFSENKLEINQHFSIYLESKKEFFEQKKSFDSQSPPDFGNYSNFGQWENYVWQKLEETDDLIQIYGLKINQRHYLKNLNINTLTEFCNTNLTTVITDKKKYPTYLKLQKQALVQLQYRNEKHSLYILKEKEDNRGLNRLPAYTDYDLYFDIETCRFYDKELVYLFGIEHLINKHEEFKDWWAYNFDQEEKIFIDFMQWIIEWHKINPHSHIYHYNHYETTNLKRLSIKYHVFIEEIEKMIAHGVFVDLLTITREAFYLAHPSYSLKTIEKIYMEESRSGVVQKADKSVLEFYRWSQKPDGNNWQNSAKLKELREYNKYDCLSTLKLAKWLRTLS